MPPDELGIWIGVVVGGGLGVLGGVIGTYFSVRNTKGPRERAFVIKVGLIGWILVIAFVVGLFLIPGWYKHLLWIPYALGLVLAIRYCNRTQARIREEEAQTSSAATEPER